MTPAKHASLPADILAKKPATTPAEIQDTPKPAVLEEVSEPVEPRMKGESKQCSVQVDPDRFYRLGKAKLETGKKGQQILIEALDLWLKKNKF